MNRLSLRETWLKFFKTSGELPITLEEFMEYHLKLILKNQRMSTCKYRLDLQTLGSQPTIMPKNLQGHLSSLTKGGSFSWTPMFGCYIC
jgi:hypothetical protein